MSDILVLQHAHTEPLGLISEALDSRGISYRYIRAYDGQDIPVEVGGAIGLIALGGPMSAYETDKYPYLNDEMRLIDKALAKGLLVLGVCLGSQILASVLGARVYAAEHAEIGWRDVTLTDDAAVDRVLHPVEKTFTAFHWHQDTYELPDGATKLASSAMTETQAYRHGNNAYGIQFHPEVNDFIVRDWVNSNGSYLASKGVDGRAIIDQLPARMTVVEHTGRIIFGNWADLATRYK